MDAIEDSKKFRKELDECVEKFPELFPAEIGRAYRLKEIRRSGKSGIPTRRIVVGSVACSVKPYFVTPYRASLATEAEKALFLRKFDVFFWALRIYNLATCNPTTIKAHNGWKIPAEWLNKFKYHENWLQNLLTSASMGG